MVYCEFGKGVNKFVVVIGEVICEWFVEKLVVEKFVEKSFRNADSRRIILKINYANLIGPWWHNQSLMQKKYAAKIYLGEAVVGVLTNNHEISQPDSMDNKQLNSIQLH